MTSPTQPMPRALRVARGGAGAVGATLLAALSHSIAGGDITWLAIVATMIVAWPLCTALAGRVGSLWRLSIAVVAAQFLFHWSFAGLGISASAAGSSLLGGGHHAGHAVSHAGHSMAAVGLAPSMGADTTMWMMHALAAILTISLLHRGERAAVALAGLVRRALPFSVPPLRVVESRLARLRRTVTARAALSNGLFSPAAITHRGPPLFA